MRNLKNKNRNSNRNSNRNNIRRKSNEFNISSQFTLITSIILVALTQFSILLFKYIKEDHQIILFRNNIDNRIITNFVIQLLFALIVTCIVTIIIFICIYALNSLDKSTYRDKTVTYWFKVIIQNIFFSILLFIISTVYLIVMSEYSYKISIVGIIIIIAIILILGFVIRNILMKYNIIFAKAVFCFQIFALCIVFIIQIVGNIATVSFNKATYYYDDNIAVVEINGFHEIRNARIRNVIGTESFLIRSYTNLSINKTYLVIDLTSNYIIDGEYNLSVTIDNKDFSKDFVYIFNGNEKDKEQYINRYIDRLKKLHVNDSEKKVYYDELDTLKSAYINKDSTEAIAEGNKINNMTNNKSTEIILSLMRDNIVGFLRNELL